MDSILNYWPNVVQEIKDFQQVAAAVDPEVAELKQVLKNAVDDQFIGTATENGISRREANYNLDVKDTDTLEDRRFRLFVKEGEEPPYTTKSLRQQLATLCGENGYTLDVQPFLVIARVALTARSNVDDVKVLLDNVVPSNMVIDFSLLYNKYGDYEARTHAEINAYTHEQLRSEVM